MQKTNFKKKIINESTLIIGFRDEILKKLREHFNVSHAISKDQSAESNWDDIVNLRFETPQPPLSEEIMKCLSSLKKDYQKYANFRSRHHPYVPYHEPENINRMMLYFYHCHSIIKQNKIQLAIFSNFPHLGFDLVLYHILKSLGIRTVICHQSLIPNKFYITEDINNFGDFTNNPTLSESKIEEYAPPSKWFYMNKIKKPYNIKNALKDILKKRELIPAIFRLKTANAHTKEKAKTLSKPSLLSLYIYFPLHLQPELTTSALGGDYSDQLLAIEALNAWIPDGYLIYVKDNPKQNEQERGKLFYKRLSALSKTKLIDQKTDSNELIKNSCCVATVTGTVGWEALFQKKPVIVFGLAWYRKFTGVNEFHPKLDFQTIINGQKPSKDHLIHELNQTISKCGTGVVYRAYNVLVEDFTRETNAQKICHSLINYIKHPQPNKNETLKEDTRKISW